MTRNNVRMLRKSMPDSELPPLVTTTSYPTFDILRLQVPMIPSVNRKYGTAMTRNGRRMYITPAYRKALETLEEAARAEATKVGWQVYPTDFYLIYYYFSFHVPRRKNQKTGDNHNPLKPCSDALVKAGVLYDDDPTYQEVVTKRLDEEGLWAQVNIYRFRGPTYAEIPFEALALSYLLSREPERKPA